MYCFLKHVLGICSCNIRCFHWLIYVFIKYVWINRYFKYCDFTTFKYKYVEKYKKYAQHVVRWHNSLYFKKVTLHNHLSRLGSFLYRYWHFFSMNYSCKHVRVYNLACWDKIICYMVHSKKSSLTPELNE